MAHARRRRPVTRTEEAEDRADDDAKLALARHFRPVRDLLAVLGPLVDVGEIGGRFLARQTRRGQSRHEQQGAHRVGPELQTTFSAVDLKRGIMATSARENIDFLGRRPDRGNRRASLARPIDKRPRAGARAAEWLWPLAVAAVTAL